MKYKVNQRAHYQDRILRCDRCESIVCIRCVKKYVESMAEFHITPEHSVWLSHVFRFLESDDKEYVIPGCDSHCCFLRERRQTIGQKRKAECLDEPSVPVASEQTKTSINLDGLLHYPTSRAFIAPSFQYPDVIAVARQSTHPVTEGVLHSVTRPDDALEWESRGVQPRFDGNNIIADFRSEVSIVHPLDGSKQDVKLRITILRNYSIPNYAKGTGKNIKLDEDVEMQNLLLSSKSCRQERKKHKTDLWLVLGGK